MPRIRRKGGQIKFLGSLVPDLIGSDSRLKKVTVTLKGPNVGSGPAGSLFFSKGKKFIVMAGLGFLHADEWIKKPQWSLI